MLWRETLTLSDECEDCKKKKKCGCDLGATKKKLGVKVFCDGASGSRLSFINKTSISQWDGLWQTKRPERKACHKNLSLWLTDKVYHRQTHTEKVEETTGSDECARVMDIVGRLTPGCVCCFKMYLSIILATCQQVLLCVHESGLEGYLCGGAVGSTAASHQEGAGFESVIWPGLSVWNLHVVPVFGYFLPQVKDLQLVGFG